MHAEISSVFWDLAFRNPRNSRAEKPWEWHSEVRLSRHVSETDASANAGLEVSLGNAIVYQA